MSRLFCLLSLLLMITFPTQAFNEFDFIMLNPTQILNRAIPDLTNLKWKVGEFQERQVKKGGIRGATLISWVDREEGEAFWLINELKVIFKKKQVIEALIERKTGKILKYIEDGEEKSPPDLNEMKDCIEISEAVETVKVPAGQYKSLRTIIRCPEESIALWENSEEVNLSGQVRQAILTKEENPEKYEYLIELTKFGQK